MSRISSEVSPSSPGAGRVVDVAWPSPEANPWSGVSVNASSRVQGPAIGILAHTTFTGGDTASFTIHNGVDCAKFVTPALANEGGFWGSQDVFRAHPRTTKGHFIAASCDDWAVWRCIGNIAYDTIPGADSDLGITIAQQTNGGINMVLSSGVNNADGFVISRSTDGSMYFYFRTGGVLTKTKIGDSAAGFDPTLFHSYEIRMINATQSADAVLKVFVDGTQVTQFSWGVGTVLPVASSANPGFAAGVSAMTSAAAAQTMYVAFGGFRVIKGPTEAACL